jgi:hypothetical protein
MASKKVLLTHKFSKHSVSFFLVMGEVELELVNILEEEKVMLQGCDDGGKTSKCELHHFFHCMVTDYARQFTFSEWEITGGSSHIN